jgi:hypothetical protein
MSQARCHVPVKTSGSCSTSMPSCSASIADQLAAVIQATNTLSAQQA